MATCSASSTPAWTEQLLQSFGLFPAPRTTPHTVDHRLAFLPRPRGGEDRRQLGVHARFDVRELFLVAHDGGAWRAEDRIVPGWNRIRQDRAESHGGVFGLVPLHPELPADLLRRFQPDPEMKLVTVRQPDREQRADEIPLEVEVHECLAAGAHTLRALLRWNGEDRVRQLHLYLALDRGDIPTAARTYHAATSAGQVPSRAEAEVGPSAQGQAEAESRHRLRSTLCRTDLGSRPNRNKGAAYWEPSQGSRPDPVANCRPCIDGPNRHRGRRRRRTALRA